MKNILTKGRGIIITGAPGVGKSSLAKAIATSIGFYAVADFKGVTGPFNSVFLVGAEAMIIEEFNPTEENLEVATTLVANDKIAVERQGYDTQIVAAPRFIFVTGSVDALKLDPNDRRFTVINIGG